MNQNKKSFYDSRTRPWQMSCLASCNKKLLKPLNTLVWSYSYSKSSLLVEIRFSKISTFLAKCPYESNCFMLKYPLFVKNVHIFEVITRVEMFFENLHFFFKISTFYLKFFTVKYASCTLILLIGDPPIPIVG